MGGYLLMQIYRTQVAGNLNSIRIPLYNFLNFYDDLESQLVGSWTESKNDNKVVKDPRYCPALFLTINEIYLEIMNLKKRGCLFETHLLDEGTQSLLRIIDDFPIFEDPDIECLQRALPAQSLEEIVELDYSNLNDRTNRTLVQCLNSKYPKLFKTFEELINLIQV